MDPFQQFGRTFNHAFDNLNQLFDSASKGGRNLIENGSSFLTRFVPRREEQHGQGFPQWGLLAAEVTENDQCVVVKVEAPGIAKEDCDIRIEGRQLQIRGEKRIDHETVGDRHHLTERAYGRFERIVPLPVNVDEDSAKASLKDGVLRIELRKQTSTPGRRIDIQ